MIRLKLGVKLQIRVASIAETFYEGAFPSMNRPCLRQFRFLHHQTSKRLKGVNQREGQLVSFTNRSYSDNKRHNQNIMIK